MCPAELHCVYGCIIYVKISIHPVVVVKKPLKYQCNQCYSDFTIGISKVLLIITTGYIDFLTYYTTIFTLM
jgi:hypothetical protein